MFFSFLIGLSILSQGPTNDADIRHRLLAGWRKIDERYSKPFHLDWKEVRKFIHKDGKTTLSSEQDCKCESLNDKCFLNNRDISKKFYTIAGWNGKYIWGLRQSPVAEKWIVNAISNDWESDIGKMANRIKYKVIRPDTIFFNLNSPDDLRLEDWINLKSLRIISNKSVGGFTHVKFLCDLPQYHSKDLTVTGIAKFDEANNYALVHLQYSNTGGVKVTVDQKYADIALNDGYRPCVQCKRVLDIPDGNTMTGEYEYNFKYTNGADEKQFYISSYGLREPDDISQPDNRIESNSSYYFWALIVIFVFLLIAALYFRRLSIRSKQGAAP